MINPLPPHLPPIPTPEQPARNTRPADNPVSTAPPDLSPAETRMIARFFPPSPVLHLRLYGPGQTSQELNPSALGNRLDVRG